MTEYENELKEAFPEVDPGIRPFGSRVLVQIKTPKTKTKSGLFLGNDLVETEKWNTQTAKVISLGPLAFKNRDTMKAWPEGDWCKPLRQVAIDPKHYVYQTARYRSGLHQSWDEDPRVEEARAKAKRDERDAEDRKRAEIRAAAASAPSAAASGA